MMTDRLNFLDGTVFYKDGDFATTVFNERQVDAIRMIVRDEMKKDSHLSEKQANRIAKDIEDRIADAFTGDTGTDDSIY